jgi:hypothetical protein
MDGSTGIDDGATADKLNSANRRNCSSDAARARRIYAVLLDANMRTEWQKQGLAEVLDFPFYDKNSATDQSMRLGDDGRISPKFMQRISDLATVIAARIKELRGQGAPTNGASNRRHGTVVLAAVPGEIEERWTELAEFLTGKGWQVLPERRGWLAEERDAATELIRLRQDCELHAQGRGDL